MKLVDIGVNLTNKRFSDDTPAVIERAQLAGVTQQVITGTCLNESRRALALCQQYPKQLYCTAGIHPHDADQSPDDYLAQLEVLATNPAVKAIGECGLDFNRNFSTPENQKRVFSGQLELASKLNMPVFLHQRDAFDTWLDILKTYLPNIPRAVSHCFTGNLDELKACLDMGLYIGITGWICDTKRGQELFDIARYIPLDRLMIETDAPYLLPKTMRPKPKSSRNEPSYLPAVLAQLSHAMAIDSEILAEKTYLNSLSFFDIDHSHCD